VQSKGASFVSMHLPHAVQVVRRWPAPSGGSPDDDQVHFDRRDAQG